MTHGREQQTRLFAYSWPRRMQLREKAALNRFAHTSFAVQFSGVLLRFYSDGHL